jgi:iron complex transport system substrate-binding protein
MNLYLFIKSIRLILPICLLIFVGAACNWTTSDPSVLSDSAGCQTVQHEFGNTKICGQPQRVIASDPGALDLLLALGVNPVGYASFNPWNAAREVESEISYLKNHFTATSDYIGLWSSLSVEAMLKLNPDLIVMTYTYGNSTQYNQFSGIAPTLPLAGSDFPWQQRLATLGRVLNREQQAGKVLERNQQKVIETKARLEPVSRDTNVLLIYFARPDHILIYTDKIFAGALLKDLGFQLVIPQRTVDVDGLIRGISLEVLPQFEADMIIVLAAGTEGVKQTKQLWEQHPILKSITDEVEQVYFLDGYLWGYLDGPIAAEAIIDDFSGLLLDRQNSE